MKNDKNAMDERKQKIFCNLVQERRPDGGDIVVLSIHWGGNWGYHITRTEREFAHRLIDSGMVDIVHGHSSHHAKAVEV